jgi:hypothetical protein
LGLFVDKTTGTGWCFGGPNLPANAIDAKARYDAKSSTVALVPAMKVKRAGPGGEGPMLNPFSTRAMTRYLERFAQAFDESGAALPRAQYHDSFEYKSDWSPELLDYFWLRHGYDLRAHLPVFFGDRPAGELDARARVKCDYREAMAELHRESIERWTDWAHRRGMVTRNQAHGSPSNLLDVYATSDIPETEMFGAPEFPIPGLRRDPAMVRDGDSDPNASRRLPEVRREHARDRSDQPDGQPDSRSGTAQGGLARHEGRQHRQCELPGLCPHPMADRGVGAAGTGATVAASATLPGSITAQERRSSPVCGRRPDHKRWARRSARRSTAP